VDRKPVIEKKKSYTLPRNYFTENYSGSQIDQLVQNLLKNYNEEEIMIALNSKSKRKSKKSKRK
jgi:hypothetical protein